MLLGPMLADSLLPLFQSRRLKSSNPGMIKKAAAAPSKAPVERREEWVLCETPKNSIAKSIAKGAAAIKSHFRAGVSVFLNDLARG